MTLSSAVIHLVFVEASWQVYWSSTEISTPLREACISAVALGCSCVFNLLSYLGRGVVVAVSDASTWPFILLTALTRNQCEGSFKHHFICTFRDQIWIGLLA